MERDEEIYLGDGLYLRFYGGEARLRAPRQDGDHVVYLGRYMLKKLADHAREQGMLE